MLLPGGLVHQGQRLRQAKFFPLNGNVDLALADALVNAGNHIEHTSLALACCVESLDGKAFKPSWCDELCVTDRQFLMCQLNSYLQPGPRWMTTHCVHCYEAFDFQLDYADIPCKAASDSFPQAKVPTSQGTLRIRVPKASDQLAIYAENDVVCARRLLLERLIVWPANSEPQQFTRLTQEDLAALEAALEDMSPELATSLQVDCPHCKKHNQVPLDLYPTIGMDGNAVMQEIHVLASHYHWSEADILALPTHRRRRYLAMIDRSRGLQSQGYLSSASATGALSWAT